MRGAGRDSTLMRGGAGRDSTLLRGGAGRDSTLLRGGAGRDSSLVRGEARVKRMKKLSGKIEEDSAEYSSEKSNGNQEQVSPSIRPGSVAGQNFFAGSKLGNFGRILSNQSSIGKLGSNRGV